MWLKSSRLFPVPTIAFTIKYGINNYIFSDAISPKSIVGADNRVISLAVWNALRISSLTALRDYTVILLVTTFIKHSLVRFQPLLYV